LREGAVTVILSGNRPEKEVAATTKRFASIDGRLGDLDSDKSSLLVPLISDHWGNNFKWRGQGPLPAEERQRLAEIVAKAHEQGRRVRFWATPEKPEMWTELLQAEVDLIGTDDLDALSRFLSSS